MSIGFIMYEIVDMDSLKNQGINTYTIGKIDHNEVGYSLKNQGINTSFWSISPNISWIFT